MPCSIKPYMKPYGSLNPRVISIKISSWLLSLICLKHLNIKSTVEAVWELFLLSPLLVIVYSANN